MGTYSLSSDEIKPYLLEALKKATDEENGDISAESIAEAYNNLAKRYLFGDRLCAMEKCLKCNKYYPITEKQEGKTYYVDEECKKCREKLKEMKERK